MGLRDLEVLKYQVVDDRSRVLIAEVVKCYEGGAYRAALVSLWVAVVADLTGKMRYLAESGDGAAKEAIDSLDNAHKNGDMRKLQEFERNILEIAQDEFEIIRPRDRKELERLNQDRNDCAHPGYVDKVELFVPDAELVRAHLVAAIRSIFSQGPLAGKRLIEILESEIKGPSWPDNETYFLERFFLPARKRVKVNIIKLLIKGSVKSERMEYAARLRMCHAALAVCNEEPSLFEEVLREVLENWEKSGNFKDCMLVRSAGFFGDKPIFWKALPKTAKERLAALLVVGNFDFLYAEKFFVHGPPADPDILQRSNEIVANLNRWELSAALRQAVNRRPYIPEVIKRVRESSSYQDAESNLFMVEDCSTGLDEGSIASLRCAIEGNRDNQVLHASLTETILARIYSKSSSTDSLREEWRKLAESLHRSGKSSGGNYRYEGLLNLVWQDV